MSIDIEEREQSLSAVDDMDFGSQGRERAGIFAANHTGPDDDHLFRDKPKLENFIGIANMLMLEGEFRRPDGGMTRSRSETSPPPALERNLFLQS